MSNTVIFANSVTPIVQPYPIYYDSVNGVFVHFDGKAINVTPLNVLKAQSGVTVTSTSGTHGTPLTLTSSGGSGTGAVTYAVTSAGTAGATLTGGGTTVSGATAGTCKVTATKAADATYLVASSTATTVTFA